MRFFNVFGTALLIGALFLMYKAFDLVLNVDGGIGCITALVSAIPFLASLHCFREAGRLKAKAIRSATRK